MKWMEFFLEDGQLAGKITCPNKKCGAKLGNYDWAGVCCNCKEWVVPVRPTSQPLVQPADLIFRAFVFTDLKLTRLYDYFALGRVRLGRLLPLNLLLIVEPSILLHHHFHQVHISPPLIRMWQFWVRILSLQFVRGGEVRSAHQSSAEKQGSFC
jgi:hypothetical protein